MRERNVMALTVARGSAVERFDPPLELGQHGIAFAVECTAGGDLDPAFADAILADVVEADPQSDRHQNDRDEA